MKSLLLIFSLAVAAAAQDAKPVLALKTTTDFLALHVNGKAPPATTAVQYRLGDADWSVAKTAIAEDGAFAFDIALPDSRWSVLHMRALKDGEVLAARETRAKARTFTMLTAERISAMPAWMDYVVRSEERFAREFDTLAAECRSLGLAQAKAAPGSRAEFEVEKNAAREWFAGAETQRIADAVMSFQTPSGGWSKAVDYTKGTRSPGTHWTSQPGEGGWHYCGTLDNRATTEQVKFLAGVFTATKRDDAKAAALRGIEYLLEAQFPNGGWPQNYPVESGYHEAVTLNDNAMVHALELLLDVADAKEPFAFADDALRQRVRAAFDRGIACLLAAQVKVDGQLTVWCAQHDPLTLAPVAARKKEPPSLSGGESAEVLRFLMRSGPVNAATTAAIEAGVRWLDAHRITGLRKMTVNGKTSFAADPSSPEVWWARFYNVKTAQPMFAGSQDGIVYSTFAEMAARNKVSYDFYTTKPRDVIGKEVERWRKRIAKSK